MNTDWLGTFLTSIMAMVFSLVMVGILARIGWFFIEIGWNLFWLTL